MILTVYMEVIYFNILCGQHCIRSCDICYPNVSRIKQQSRRTEVLSTNRSDMGRSKVISNPIRKVQRKTSISNDKQPSQAELPEVHSDVGRSTRRDKGKHQVRNGPLQVTENKRSRKEKKREVIQK